jgi:hypothetical protein
MLKKGMLGEQFNWIFVIVAGVMLLTFFIVFTVKYINLQEDRMDVDVARSLSLRFFGLAQSHAAGGLIIDDTEGGAYSFNPGHDVQLRYTCLGDVGEIVINGNEEFARMKVTEEIVFAPTAMSISSIDTWVYPWNHPFFVSNFIFLSPPERTYYFIGDHATLSNFDMYSKVQFNVQPETNLNSIISDLKGDGRVVIFQNGGNPGSYTSGLIQLTEKFKFFSALYVDLTNEQVYFFKEDEWSGALPYYSFVDEAGVSNDALLYSAIFSDSDLTYECGLNKAMKRLQTVSVIYALRLNLFAQTDPTPGCPMAYGSMKSQLGNFVNDPKKESAQVLNNLNNGLVGSGCKVAF